MGGLGPISKIIHRAPIKNAKIVSGDANPALKNTDLSPSLKSIIINGGCLGSQVIFQKGLMWGAKNALSASSVLIPSAFTIYEKRAEFKSKDQERIIAATDHVGISIINGLTASGVGTIVVSAASLAGWPEILVGCGVATLSYYFLLTIQGWIGLEEIIDRNHGLNSSKKTAPERT